MTKRDKTALEYLANEGLYQSRLLDDLTYIHSDMHAILHAVLRHCDMLEDRIKELEER